MTATRRQEEAEWTRIDDMAIVLDDIISRVHDNYTPRRIPVSIRVSRLTRMLAACESGIDNHGIPIHRIFNFDF